MRSTTTDDHFENQSLSSVIIKQESNLIGPTLSAADKEKLRRNRNLEIKKKYGLTQITHIRPFLFFAHYIF